MSTPVVVSVGATHPWNIAGLGLDLQIGLEYGVRNITVVAGVTAQDQTSLRDKFSIPPAMLRAQLDALPRGVAAFRIGALFEEASIHELALFLATQGETPVVLDPVLKTTPGAELADGAAVRALRSELFALPIIVTPNIDEAQRLTNRKILQRDEMIAAAHAILAMGPRAVLLKGGHMEGDPIDVLATRDDTRMFRDSRLPGSMRGTGCALAMSLACELAKGKDLNAAVQAARRYTRSKIEAQIPFASMQVAF